MRPSNTYRGVLKPVCRGYIHIIIRRNVLFRKMVQTMSHTGDFQWAIFCQLSEGGSQILAIFNGGAQISLITIENPPSIPLVMFLNGTLLQKRVYCVTMHTYQKGVIRYVLLLYNHKSEVMY